MPKSIFISYSRYWYFSEVLLGMKKGFKTNDHRYNWPLKRGVKLYTYMCYKRVLWYTYQIWIPFLYFFILGWKPPTITVRLDFLKCVHIFLSSKTQICTEKVSRFSRQHATQICTETRKSRHTFCADLRFEENENPATLEKI